MSLIRCGYSPLATLLEGELPNERIIGEFLKTFKSKLLPRKKYREFISHATNQLSSVSEIETISGLIQL